MIWKDLNLTFKMKQEEEENKGEGEERRIEGGKKEKRKGTCKEGPKRRDEGF